MTGIIVSIPPTVEVPPGSNSSNPSSLPSVTYSYALLNLPQTWAAKQTFPAGNISISASDITSGTLPAAQLPTFTQNGTGAVAWDFQDKVRETLSVTDFGAKGNGVFLSDGAISASSKSFSSASASFVPADAGKLIRIAGAGAAGATLETTIAAYVSATSVTLTDAASTTVSGAKAAYGSDDTNAIQKAINAAAGQVASSFSVYVPRGIYLTTTPINIWGPVRFHGDGADIFGSTGSIIQPSRSSNAINVTGQPAVVLENFGVFYVATPSNTTDAAINIDSGGGAAYNYFSRYRNIAIANCYNGIRFRQAIYGVADNINIQEYANVGIVISEDNPASFGDFGNLKIVNSNIFAFVQTPVAAVLWTSGGGFSFHNNTCLGGTFGVSLNPRPNSDMTQVSIFGNQMDSLTNAAIQYVRQDSTANLQELVVANNTSNHCLYLLKIPTDAGGIGIKTVTVVGNVIRGALSASARPITIDSADNVTIADNSILSNNASTVGITIGSAATNVVLGANSFSGTFANDWTNASSSFKAANGVQPNLGGILYSGSDRVSLLNGTAVAGQMLRSGNVAAPTWSTATWPATTTINQLLYSSSANTIAGLATANSSLLLTNGSGVPAWSTTLPRANGGGATSVAGEQSALASGNLVYVLTGANFNSTADQPITFVLPTGYTRYRLGSVVVSNPSISLTTAVGGIYTAASKGGLAVVAASQAYSSLTTNTPGANGSMLLPVVTNQSTAFYNSTTLFLSLTTAQGAAATADVAVFIQPIP